MLVSLMTAFYMFRLLFLTFHGSFRGTHEQEHHLHESPFTMTFPLIVLAIFSVIAGFIGFPHALGEQIGIHNWFDEFLKPSVDSIHLEADAGTELTMMGITTALILIVIFIARSIYLGKGTVPADESIQRKGLQKLIYNKFYVDELYNALFTKPVDKISAFLHDFMDRKVVDGLVNGLGKTTVKSGSYIRILQSGNINLYALLFILAISLLFLIILF